jgi:type II secretory pathway pseudopilin PulG
MTRFADESGETLMELLITIVIMAIGLTAVMAALLTTIVGSDVHNSMSQGEVVARDYGEAIKMKAISAGTYTACPTAAQLTPTLDASLVRAGWTPTITKVEYWDGKSPTNLTFIESQDVCLNGDPDQAIVGYLNCIEDYEADDFIAHCDPGLQRVTYEVKNFRNDAGKVDMYARVLVRRNNANADAEEA